MKMQHDFFDQSVGIGISISSLVLAARKESAKISLEAKGDPTKIEEACLVRALKQGILTADDCKDLRSCFSQIKKLKSPKSDPAKILSNIRNIQAKAIIEGRISIVSNNIMELCTVICSDHIQHADLSILNISKSAARSQIDEDNLLRTALAGMLIGGILGGAPGAAFGFGVGFTTGLLCQ